MRRRTGGELTEAAKAAKAIKAELKEAFPSIKFSVRSKNFAGGDSVRIDWTNGPPDKAVEKITNKYEYGHFDGMIDLYEYSNVRNDIPQAKYVFAGRTITDEVRAAKKAEIAEKFGVEDPENEDHWWKIFSRWSNEVVYKELRDLILN
jgi:hypothetical protein